VCLRRLSKPLWRVSTGARVLPLADGIEEVYGLKQQLGQDILVAGSVDLVRTLMQHDLIDEYRLMVHPVVLESGKRLFGDGSEKKVLKLVDTKTFSSGVVVLSYQPDSISTHGCQ
jgi:dihydrofolate reductase